jgi:hypothetical protein
MMTILLLPQNFDLGRATVTQIQLSAEMAINKGVMVVSYLSAFHGLPALYLGEGRSFIMMEGCRPFYVDLALEVVPR